MSESSLYMRKFLRNVTFFAAGVFVLALLFNWLAPAEIVTPALYYMIAFFYALSVLVHFLLISASKKKFAHFNNRYMLATVVKLLLFMVILIVYVFVFPEDAVNFLITFLVLYVLFTGFEVFAIVQTTRKIKSEEE